MVAYFISHAVMSRSERYPRHKKKFLLRQSDSCARKKNERIIPSAFALPPHTPRSRARDDFTKKKNASARSVILSLSIISHLFCFRARAREDEDDDDDDIVAFFFFVVFGIIPKRRKKSGDEKRRRQ